MTKRLFAALIGCLLLFITACNNPSDSTIATSSTIQTETTVPPTTTTTTTTTTTSSTTTATTTTTTTATTTTAPLSRALISIPVIHQFPDYPTGCESVAAVMALSHAGHTITVEDFISNHLSCSTDFYWWEQQFYGPSPYEYFLGNPRTSNSYGCMAPVIRKAIEQYLGSSDRVIDATGQDLASLCDTYVRQNIPVIVWVSINMSAIKDGRQWILPDGTTFTWPSGEHCMLLVGCDDTKYYFNDPYTGQVVHYARALCESRYTQMGQQALVVLPSQQ